MNLKQKLNRIERLLCKIQKLERPFADAISRFSHAHANLDQTRLAHAPKKFKEVAERRAVGEVESATAALLEEIETPTPTEWDRTVTELAALGVERNYNSIGTARRLYAELRSYMAYLGLKDKCELENKPFPQCWADPLTYFARSFAKVTGD